MIRAAAICFAVLAASVAQSAEAQGLIWKLPEDGSWVRYEGSYKQVEARPDSTQGNLEIEWIRHVTIRSVGTRNAEWKGNQVACRWIEFKIQTGKIDQGAINTGTVGERIYKVLVPEDAVLGTISDREGLPVSYLPIVEGWRKTNDADPTPMQIKSGVLQVYPMISLIRHYKSMEEQTAAETVPVGMNDVSAKVMRGSLEQESLTHRILHESTLYRSDEVPFGLARWTVKISSERKADVEPRTAFKFASEITVEMNAREIGTDAPSELVIPGQNQ